MRLDDALEEDHVGRAQAQAPDDHPLPDERRRRWCGPLIRCRWRSRPGRRPGARRRSRRRSCVGLQNWPVFGSLSAVSVHDSLAVRNVAHWPGVDRGEARALGGAGAPGRSWSSRKSILAGGLRVAGGAHVRRNAGVDAALVVEVEAEAREAAATGSVAGRLEGEELAARVAAHAAIGRAAGAGRVGQLAGAAHLGDGGRGGLRRPGAARVRRRAGHLHVGADARAHGRVAGRHHGGAVGARCAARAAGGVDEAGEAAGLRIAAAGGAVCCGAGRRRLRARAGLADLAEGVARLAGLAAGAADGVAGAGLADAGLAAAGAVGRSARRRRAPALGADVAERCAVGAGRAAGAAVAVLPSRWHADVADAAAGGAAGFAVQCAVPTQTCPRCRSGRRRRCRTARRRRRRRCRRSRGRRRCPAQQPAQLSGTARAPSRRRRWSPAVVQMSPLAAAALAGRSRCRRRRCWRCRAGRRRPRSNRRRWPGCTSPSRCTRRRCPSGCTAGRWPSSRGTGRPRRRTSRWRCHRRRRCRRSSRCSCRDRRWWWRCRRPASASQELPVAVQSVQAGAAVTPQAVGSVPRRQVPPSIAAAAALADAAVAAAAGARRRRCGWCRRRRCRRRARSWRRRRREVPQAVVADAGLAGAGGGAAAGRTGGRGAGAAVAGGVLARRRRRRLAVGGGVGGGAGVGEAEVEVIGESRAPARGGSEDEERGDREADTEPEDVAIRGFAARVRRLHGSCLHRSPRPAASVRFSGKRIVSVAASEAGGEAGERAGEAGIGDDAEVRVGRGAADGAAGEGQGRVRSGVGDRPRRPSGAGPAARRSAGRAQAAARSAARPGIVGQTARVGGPSRVRGVPARAATVSRALGGRVRARVRQATVARIAAAGCSGR